MQPNKGPKNLGIWATIAWLLFVLGGCLLYPWPEGSGILELKPNEAGDFLAGIFAPLAVVWIVVAYLHQAEELRLQVKELSQQVAATRQMADAALAQGHREERKIQPVFVVRNGSGKGGRLSSFTIINRGDPAKDVKLKLTDGGPKLEAPTPPPFMDREREELGILIHSDTPGWFSVGYSDKLGHTQEVWFYFDGNNKILSRGFGGTPLRGTDLNQWLARNGVKTSS